MASRRISGRRGRIVAALAMLATAFAGGSSAFGASTAADAVGKADIVYVVMAHPDDETSGWQLIDDFAGSYVVFVLITHGERSAACVTEELSWTYPYDSGKHLDGEPGVGPYRYEGPGGPVKQPDEGERLPFGNPWEGQDTTGCGRAKVASWHWFLDDVAAFTPGLPNLGVSAGGDPWADDSLATHCPGPFDKHDRRRAPEKPKHQEIHWDPALGCVDVWADSAGARVVFDLGDGGWPADTQWPEKYLDPDPIDAAEVVAALETVRTQRAAWGLPTLPESAVVAAAAGCDPHGPADPGHFDHEAVQDAVYTHDFDAGTQYGVVCDGATNHYGSLADRRFVESPGPVQPVDALTWWRLNETHPDPTEPGTVTKVGPMARNYGWIAEGSTGTYDFPFHVMWQRFG